MDFDEARTCWDNPGALVANLSQNLLFYKRCSVKVDSEPSREGLRGLAQRSAQELAALQQPERRKAGTARILFGAVISHGKESERRRTLCGLRDQIGVCLTSSN